MLLTRINVHMILIKSLQRYRDVNPLRQHPCQRQVESQCAPLTCTSSRWYGGYEVQLTVGVEIQILCIKIADVLDDGANNRR